MIELKGFLDKDEGIGVTISQIAPFFIPVEAAEITQERQTGTIVVVFKVIIPRAYLTCPDVDLGIRSIRDSLACLD